MKPSYYRALMQARKCNEKATKELFDFIKETQNNLDEETKDNLERLYRFIEYAKTDDALKYRNVFEILNVGENSISRLIEWCLNVKSEENKDDNIIGKIKYQVCDEFLNFIDEINNNSKQARKLIECNILNFNDKKYDGEYSKYNDNDVKFDIVLEAKFKLNDNNYKTYLYVIENKKNAKINCNPRKDGSGEWVTQLEMYYHTACKYAEDKKLDPPKFVFMCAHECYLENRLILSDIPELAKCKLTIKDQYGKKYNKNEVCSKNVRWLLGEAFNYKLIEHSKFVIDLFKVLKNNLYNNYFTKFGTIKPTLLSDKQIIELLSKLLADSNFNQNNIDIFLNEIQNINFQKNAIMHNMDILPRLEEYKKEKINVSKSLGSIEINFKNILDNIKGNDLILEILFRYIEYWELHHDVGRGRDYIEGYTKIINESFIQDVCTDIFTNNKLMSKISKYPEIRKVIVEIAMFKLIEPLVDIFTWEIIKSDESGKNKKWLNDNEKKNISFDNHIIKIKHKRHYLYYKTDDDELIWVNCNNINRTKLICEEYSKICETKNQEDRDNLEKKIRNAFGLNTKVAHNKTFKCPKLSDCHRKF